MVASRVVGNGDSGWPAARRRGIRHRPPDRRDVLDLPPRRAMTVKRRRAATRGGPELRHSRHVPNQWSARRTTCRALLACRDAISQTYH